MKRACVLLTWLAVSIAVPVSAEPAAPGAPPPFPPPPPARANGTFPSFPSVARIRLEASRDHVLVVEEVLLPRGNWQSGDLDLYVAFGAPGSPRAFDAHIVQVADGALEPEGADVGEPVPLERAPRRPNGAQALLGPQTMAGAVLHIHDAAFRRAIAPGGMAALRLRTLLSLPADDVHGGREVLVRLGSALGSPLTIGRMQISAAPFVQRAEARLCGPEADAAPLAIAVTTRAGAQSAPAIVLSHSASTPPPLAPVLAVRHATDDVCIRFWTQGTTTQGP